MLLIDDYEDTRELYGTYLRDRGYQIEDAEDGFEGVAKAVALLPALIVMDLDMPLVDGWTATEMLKKDARTAAIPVICLTAHDRPEERSRASSAGCDVFLRKPCLPAALNAEVGRMLGSSA
ncbi:MAG TPA: response regulator [Luteitalea sp.]|nr:response regulator [Luteitalea sp.]